ncbi:triple tyrosine motif-containing protein [Cesiribacter sp. SM1]|uniref:triple tyrosine motif-containing protein n=1 Tax=Cesiribacter sp. SM1 TaxID=2861196 RepID=UPI001CD1CE95|nr:triple tyrosine motif-containing protein [Cesiribacter sp. SM1]
MVNYNPKMYFTRLFYGLLLLLQAAPVMAQKGIPLVKNFGTVDYGAGIQNWQIAQDSRGLIYVANNFGLLEYDGNLWRNYGAPSGTKVRCLTISADDKVYVGSQGDFGYFAPNAQGSLQFTSLADSLPASKRNFDETWRVFLDGNKAYFCTFRHIFVFQNDKLWKVLDPQAPLEPSFYVNHRLYVLLKGVGLMQYKGDKLEPLPDTEALAHSSISAIIPYNQQQVLITTFQDGIYLYDGHKLERWQTPAASLLEPAIINDALLLKNGHFAFGTQSEGLVITDRNGVLQQQLTKERGFNNRTVLSLFQDVNSNLWVGMNNGIAFVELSAPFRLLNEQAGLPGTGYTALLHQDTLYLGTNNGLYRLDSNHASPELVPGTRGQVYSITQLGNHVLMGHHNGAFRIGKQKAEPLFKTTGFWMFKPLRQAPDKLVGGTYNGLTLFDKVASTDSWKYLKPLKGLEESARLMEQAADGSIWMVHGYKGAYNIRLSANADSILSAKHYNTSHGFPSNNRINVYRIENDLVFPAETGIYRYNPTTDRFVLDEKFTSLLGADNHVEIMKDDAFGNIYYVSSKEIGVLRKDPIKGYVKETAQFNRLLGLLNDDLQNLTVLSDHSLLLGAKEGFIHYNPFEQAPDNAGFKTLLRTVQTTSGGDSLLYGGHGKGFKQSPELNHNANSLKFSFASTSYDALSRPRYQYYLEPYESNWSAWTNQSEKEYTNLPEGKYTFHVRSQNSLGQQSQEALYTLTILPPWYRTAWAYSLYVFLASAMLLLMLQFQHRRHKKEKDHIVRRQEEELSLRDTQLEEVARKSEEEINRLRNEKLMAEVEHKNKELATQTMSIISKNEFITDIKENLSSISKKSTNREVMHELQKIVRDIERTIDVDIDWEHFQYHFDQVHGDFSNRLRSSFPSLSPQEIKLCTYLRLNLSTKEIAQLLNISVRGVEISRYRLRKKLGLNREENLTDFMLKF